MFYVMDHDSLWEQAFYYEQSRLMHQLGFVFENIFHIGSTAIPSVKAKPVLDLLGIVPSLDIIDQYQKDLEALNYVWKGEYGISGRRYNSLYNSSFTKDYIHLHIFPKDHPDVKKQLIFRDVIRANPQLAQQYENLKLNLSSQFSDMREQYTSGKNEFIQFVLQQHKNLSS